MITEIVAEYAFCDAVMDFKKQQPNGLYGVAKTATQYLMEVEQDK